ncbi:hypothetical protein MG293_003257 [Ovis ammon polii]|uniref:Uncharacterized protein n=1 Tax=Ovis ammon polii TaxID=230172 RepID=A0AAD4YGT7_OVIAM|nr:hypothetical protein MG293_003257 [Ovis ammon polii]KAI4576912.1 hypothetical protein MJT46_002747 [Ovis ammon polii x Ovis aries]
MGQDTLLHRETLLIIPANDSDHITLPFFTQSISGNFCGHTLLAEGMKFSFVIYFMSFWQPVARKGMLSFILKRPTASEVPRKRASISIFEGLEGKKRNKDPQQ